jgi:hypothetical protein
MSRSQKLKSQVPSNRPIAPIEALVYKACGYKPIPPVDPWSAYRADPKRVILLQCARCRRIIVTKRMDHDPEAAARITFPCNRCNTTADKAQVQYFDADGKRIFAAWEGQG